MSALPARTTLGKRRQLCGFPRQSDLAAALGISHNYVSDVEGGARRGNDELLARWAALLAWTLEDVIAAIPHRGTRRHGLRSPHRRAAKPRTGPRRVAEVKPAPVAAPAAKPDPPPRRELSRCSTPGCGRHVGLRGPGEDSRCYLCQAREEAA